MKYLLLALILVPRMLFAQYKMDATAYRYNGAIGADEMPFWRVLAKQGGDNIFIYEKEKDTDKDTMVRYTLKRYNVKTEKINQVILLPAIPKSFHITDIIADDRFTIFVSFGKLIYFKQNTNAVFYTRPHTDFRFGYKLNDNRVLLYSLYNYHPGDGKSGLHLGIFNLASGKIEEYADYTFPGVALGHMTINWVTHDRSRIYAFAGLSGRVYVYDFKLHKIEERDMNIFPDSLKVKNVAYERQTDSLIADEWTAVKEKLKYVAAYNDTAKTKIRVVSTVYSKDFMSNTSRTVRGQYSYIEKIFKTDEDKVLLTVHRPYYPRQYRDVYTYDLITGKLQEKYLKWATEAVKELTRPEDFYPLDLGNDALAAPMFFGHKVYGVNVYDTRIFQAGPVDSLEARQFKEVSKNGYKWQLTKYSLSVL